jgi:uncharacterized cysteine cluster protein YcgN (CxxCxxCC family)
MSDSELPFWQAKTLTQMNSDEWEQLCDGCGLCCLVRIQDDDTDEIYDTNVICKHYDCSKAQCSSFSTRTSIKEGCVQLTPDLVEEFDWLPDSCAYRTLLRGDVVQIFAGPSLVKNSKKVDPANHLIAREDFDY